MFLSALISRFEPDGSLVVDLGDTGGPVVRYGAYGAGMPWHRASAGGWAETAFDWGAHLVNRAHEARRDVARDALYVLHDLVGVVEDVAVDLLEHAAMPPRGSLERRDPRVVDEAARVRLEGDERAGDGEAGEDGESVLAGRNACGGRGAAHDQSRAG
jgi:hypothetical protein